MPALPVPEQAPPQASRMEVALIAKWLIPSAAGLFAVVGYVIQSAHSSLLGGGIVAGEGSSYSSAAADFFYDLPTIAADFLLSFMTAQQMPLGGHSLPLAIAAVLVTAVCWFTTGSRCRWKCSSQTAAPVLLVLLLVAKFVWLDAPMVRIDNVVIAANQDGDAMPGWRPPSAGTGVIDRLINHRAESIWRHMACGRNPALPAADTATVNCSGLLHQDRRLAEGEFTARLLACVLVALLAWRVGRGGARWRTVLSMAGLATLLSLPYAYGKLLKPTVFEYGKVELSPALIGALGQSTSISSPMRAVVLAKRAAAVDLLVKGIGQCANQGAGPGKTYAVTKVWTVPNSQILSIREIFRIDVIAWKLSQENALNCSAARSPGSDYHP